MKYSMGKCVLLSGCNHSYARWGSVAGSELSQEAGWRKKKTGSWRLLWRHLLGEITSLSQLVAERLVLNFDPSCCTLILRRDLILFIRPGVAYSRLSTALQLHTHQRRGRGHKWSNYNFTSTFWHLEASDKNGAFGENSIIITLFFSGEMKIHTPFQPPCNPQDAHNILWCWRVVDFF